MNTKLKYIITGILALLIILFFYNKYRIAPSVDFNKLNLIDLNGQPVRFQDFKGKKVIFSFGASWCGNCVMELRDLMSIKESELKDVDVVIISDEDLETVIAFKERKNYPFTFLKMNGSFNSIGVNAIPTNYIVNKNLEIKYEKVGEIDWKDPSTLQHMKRLLE
ncbi:MAG: alkyl hydroperoxide reductase/Thiol specific antioxidant/Mal allergen [Bacteroidetes bacterium]|nr:alkyl hydroperoxide reductase/Thiol specific antioxidant/Mal allergen [Bacteroidota bacterium]